MATGEGHAQQNPDWDRVVIVIDGVEHITYIPPDVRVVTVQVDQGRNADSYVHVARDQRKPRGERKAWRQWGYGGESKLLEPGENNFTPDAP